MGSLSKIRRDTAAPQDGVWCRYEYDIQVRIRHIGFRAYQDEANRILKPERMRITTESLYNDELYRLLAPAVARHLVVNWQNIEGDDGKPIPFSLAKAIEILTDPQYVDFLEWIVDQAKNAQNYREAELQDSAGNSSGVSTGTGE